MDVDMTIRHESFRVGTWPEKGVKVEVGDIDVCLDLKDARELAQSIWRICEVLDES